MLDFLLLNGVVGILLYLTIIEQGYIESITLIKEKHTYSKLLHPVPLSIFVTLSFLATFIFLLRANSEIVKWYIRGAFFYMLIVHARILTLHRSKLISVSAIL